MKFFLMMPLKMLPKLPEPSTSKEEMHLYLDLEDAEEKVSQD